MRRYLDSQKYPATPNPSPPPATLRAIEQQATPAVKRKAEDYARVRVELLLWAGRPVSMMGARELVDDAHADTWSGLLAWDPSRCSLLEHLRQSIKKRTWMEIRHGHRVSFVPLFEPENDEAEQIVSEEVENALAEASHGNCDPFLMDAVLAKICQELRPRVSHDDAAAFVVQCWEKGSVERGIVMALTGLTAVAYERARKRLFYAIRTLSSELREVAKDLLRNAS
jgi:hypothetical protein